MRHIISGSLAAAALGTALAFAGAFPASAQVARPQSALAVGTDNSDLLTLVANRRGGGGGGHAFRGGGGGGNFAMRGGGGRGFAVRGGGGRNFAVRSGGNRFANFSRGSRFDSGRVARFDRFDHRRRVVVRRNDNFFFGFGPSLGFGLGYPYYGYGDYGYGGYGYGGYGYGGYGYGDYAYGGGDDSAVAYCMSRFRTYDRASGTYMGYDGRRHSCP